MKTLTLCAIIALFISCSNHPNPQIDNSSSNDAAASPPAAPVHKASDDLQVYDGKFRRQIFGSDLVITGTVVNKSNTINYKDVQLLVKYFSKTNTEMGSDNFTIYQYLNAGQTLNIKLKGKWSADLGTLSVNVVNATPY